MTVMWVLLIAAAMLQVSYSIPIIPKAQAVENEQPTNQNHDVDNVEVHHDVKAGQGQELIDDALPEKDDKKDANAVGGGDSKQPLVENNTDKVLETKLHIKVKPPKPKDQAEPAVAESQVLHVKPEENDENVVLSEETVKKLKKLSIDKLIPADHLDIVKMERDGHVNRDYHKEMFLGGLHDEFKAEAVDQATVRLQEIVARADLDGDGFLSSSEMEKWILAKMNEHFEAAKKENDMIFEHLDPDGIISTLQSVANDKNALISYKFKWTDADTNITDNRLSKEEFMVFRHPEHSQKSLETVVSNVMRGVDANDDKVITEEEFAALPPGEVESKEFEEMDRKWQEERRKEFREIMDTDGDGKVGLTELKKFDITK
uniref:EF-hand domain-containing protein n=1 Tax=Biomphalaria glabrata TaxID=6526 RepID=A0A2C9JU23_BIOGL